MNFTFSSDRVPALLTLFDEACRLSGRQGRRLLEGEHPKDVAEDLAEYDDIFYQDGSISPGVATEPLVIDEPHASSSASAQGDYPSSPVAAEGPGDKEEQIREAMRYLKSGKPMPVAPNLANPEHSRAGESRSNGSPAWTLDCSFSNLCHAICQS